jgi:4-hydroxy-3-methylbut-2-en-1-yl diphosphate synthase IspG/GcpE
MKPTRIAKLSLLALSLVTVATAATAQLLADFSGKWTVNVEGPQGPVTSDLDITQAGEVITGKFSSEIGEAQVKGKTWGDSLRISLELDMNGQPLSLDILGAAKDKDNMEGVVEAAGMGTFPFTAVRTQ